VDEKQRFSRMVMNLDPYAGTGSTPDQATLHLPPVNDPRADDYLAMGYVPLPHGLREGSKTVSWYHGPLLPWDNADSVDLPAGAADKLVRFSSATGLFDVSYAAAWELGRLLTLQSKQVSTSLYQWKRTRARQLHQAEQRVLHLPVTTTAPDPRRVTASPRW
jgi:hypothetical protein